MSNGPVPYNLRPKATKLPAGHDDTLDPPDPPTDPEVRGVADLDWPAQDHSIGGHGPPDAPLAPPGVDPAQRSVPPFVWPTGKDVVTLTRSMRETLPFVGALDPDIAMWPAVVVSIFPFSGPPTEGIWPVGWFGLDSTGTPWRCVVAGEPGTWASLGSGGGDISTITSTGGTITVTDATGPTTNLEVTSAATGITDLVSADNSVTITDPTGPTAGLKVALAHDANSFSGVSVPVTTPGPLISTASLAVGVWLINAMAFGINNSTALVMTLALAEGTATATFAGPTDSIIGGAAGVGAGGFYPTVVCSIVTVTVAGTIEVTGETPNSGASAFGGYTAVKIG